MGTTNGGGGGSNFSKTCKLGASASYSTISHKTRESVIDSDLLYWEDTSPRTLSHTVTNFATIMSEILKHIGDLVGSSEITASKDTANEWTQ